jgi:hypothetical protein
MYVNVFVTVNNKRQTTQTMDGLKRIHSLIPGSCEVGVPFISSADVTREACVLIHRCLLSGIRLFSCMVCSSG